MGTPGGLGTYGENRPFGPEEKSKEQTIELNKMKKQLFDEKTKFEENRFRKKKQLKTKNLKKNGLKENKF